MEMKLKKVVNGLKVEESANMLSGNPTLNFI